MDASTAFFACRGIIALPTRETHPLPEPSSKSAPHAEVYSATTITTNTSLCATGTTRSLLCGIAADSWLCADAEECEALPSCASTAGTEVGA